jgi:hypothetical protein
MKLYKIIVLHAGPKSQHTAIDTFLIAEDEDCVAEWINTEKHDGCWFEDQGTRFENGSYTSEIPFRDWVIKNCGDLDDENGWEDAYYGVTKWGWKEIYGADRYSMENLKELGAAVECGD